MSHPIQWPGGGEVRDAGEARTAELLAQARAVPAWSVDAKREVLRRVRAELGRPAPRARWIPALALGGVTALLLAVVLVRYVRQGGSPAAVVASADADFAWANEEGEDRMLALVIRAGTVEVQPRHPERAIAVHSPGLDARVEAQSFRVQVAAEVTTLSIGEGQAWVGKTVHLHHHESIRSDDPRLKRHSAPAHPAPVPSPAAAAPVAASAPAAAPCTPVGSVAQRRACLLTLSQGSDLGAENALFELGMLDQEERHAGGDALSSFQSYEARFPSGALASDACFAAMTELLAEHRGADARREGEHFLALYPQDSRAAEVRSRLRSLP